MKDRDYELLHMLPPSPNHDPFHDFVTLDGRLTDRGYAWQNFARQMQKVIADRAPKKPKLAPGERMNIGNQINFALDDVRQTLKSLANPANRDGVDQAIDQQKALYQLSTAIHMIADYRMGRDIPWEDRKLQVEEEFS